ncbi:MAG: hypothetical protein GHCLOJNM_03894 [bacterium]|nr:hypothetical protein [bacterium]
MTALRFLLVADGPSDQALLPILRWLLRTHLPARASQGEWADLRFQRNPPKSLPDRIAAAIRLHPNCELVFVHRDAEGEPLDARVSEIRAACEMAFRQFPRVIPAIEVVPVRMSEAWLLFDESAIRKAVGNPNGRVQLCLPPLNRVEELADPKTLLHGLIGCATEFTGRRLKRFRISTAIHRLSEVISDYSPLRTLSAFNRLENQLTRTIQEKGW